MKKFRMMLPVLAVVFAVVSAVGGNFLPPIEGFYKTGQFSCATEDEPLDQSNCQTGLPTSRPVCTVNIAGHPTAYDAGCVNILRQPL